MRYALWFVAMLSIGKLSGRGAAAEYYLGLRAEADRSAAGYYAEGAGVVEPPGGWFGSALGHAGMAAGVIDDEAFAALLASHEAPDGVQLGRVPRRNDGLSAYDLTMSAPKSVSLLMAYGDEETAAAAREAHAAACGEAIAWLEAEACGVRLAHGEQVAGEDGEVSWRTRYQRVDGAGFIGASFEQFTSRSLDPQLHTHHVVVNKTLGPDGTWRTLDGQRLYTSAKAAGTVYQAELRRQLTARLGVEWGTVVNGTADIAGFDRELIEHFSTRRQQVEAALEQMAAPDSPAAAQEATLSTRPRKGSPDGDAVAARWRQLEDTAPQPVRQVVASAGRRTAARSLAEVDRGRLFEAITSRLVDDAPTFDVGDVMTVAGDVLPAAVADPQAPSQVADEWMAWARTEGQLVPLLAPSGQADVPVDLTAAEASRLVDRGWMVQEVREDGSARHIRRLRWLPDRQRYTTRRLLDLEHRTLAGAGRQAGPLLDPGAVEAAIANAPTLLDEQAAMIRRLGQTQDRVAVVVGPGGSGKTFAMQVATSAHDGPVVGTAVSGAAADELGTAAGIPSHTIAQLRVDADRHGHTETFPDRVLVVVDEASMVGTNDLAWLVDQVETADGRIVLVGDPAQLPSVDAGGVFHRLVADGHAIDDLAGCNARQQLAVDRAALAELRDGHAAAAVDRLGEAGRIHLADTPIDAQVAMVDDWADDVIRHGVADTRMLAARRSDVATLNELARARMEQAGRLSGPTLEVGGRSYREGDRVVAIKNDRRYANLRNSHTGTVTAVDPQAGTVTMLRDRDGETVTLGADYAARHLDHAYATTVHKAQGATYRGNVRLYADLQGATRAEHSYVGLSRAAQEAHVYVAADQMADHIAPGVYLEDRQDPIERLVGQIDHSAVAPLAADSGRPIHSEATAALVARRDQLARQLRTIPADVSDRVAQADQALAAARDAANQPGAPLHATQRLQQLEEQHAQLMGQVEDRRQWLEEHGPKVAEYQEVAGELAARRQRRLVGLPLDEDAINVLGQPPGPDADTRTIEAWRDAAAEYVRIEQRHGTVDLTDRDATRQLHTHLEQLGEVRALHSSEPMLRPME